MQTDFNPLIADLAQALSSLGAMLATAESCTGGLIAAACTSVAGSSAWFERGFITYSNRAKTEMLGVEQRLILTHGAVSEEVARAMALGAAQAAGVAYAVSTTGIAGPSGGSADKPVGTVCFGFYLHGRLHSETQHFREQDIATPLSRSAIRQASVHHALQRLCIFLQGQDRHV